MVYEVEEPDARDPNYDESAQVSEWQMDLYLDFILCIGNICVYP